MFRKCLVLPACLGLCLVAAGAGCNRGPTYEINPQVRGAVTMDGKPLANVIIQFVPAPTEQQPHLQSPLSSGSTDEQGNFELRLDNGQRGAVIGKQKVVVIAGRSGREVNGEPAKPTTEAASKNPPIPPQFTVASDTPFSLQVTKDQHDYKVELSSKMGMRGFGDK
jgi:hypothetical protein